MVDGMPLLKAPTKVCVDCLVGKQHRENISKKSHWRASSKLQLIHSDICGLVNPESNSGKRYLITFIDEFSRKCWVYFISEKSEALNMFKRFKNLVEKKAGSLVGCLRTDRGGEFTSKEFNEYCSMNGIKRQLMAAYTPQQNGVAERMNWTIMNLVRSILLEKNIPREFLLKAVNWCMHVLNRSPTAAVLEITPEKAWSGVKPLVEYFCVFGCIGHVHVPHEKRTELDPRRTKCILLGISEETKGYKMYNPVTKKLIISRDVIFEENAIWNWAENSTNMLLRWGDDDNSISEEEFEGNEDGERAQEQIEEIGNEAGTGNEVEEPEEEHNEFIQAAAVRNRRTPHWMEDYVTGAGLSEEEETQNMVFYTAAGYPHTYEKGKKNQKWREAMDNEIAAIERNDTWELTVLPNNSRKIGVKWIYKTKLNEKGEVEKYKARLVAKGYAQQHGIDYTEVFAPVAR